MHCLSINTAFVIKHNHDNLVKMIEVASLCWKSLVVLSRIRVDKHFDNLVTTPAGSSFRRLSRRINSDGRLLRIYAIRYDAVILIKLVLLTCLPTPDYTRSRLFVFVSLNVTCKAQDALTAAFPARTRLQCANRCLARQDCHGFAFVAGDNENECIPCGHLRRENLEFRAGSQYYEAFKNQ